MAEFQEKRDEIEKGIADALKPVGERPRIFPVTDPPETQGFVAQKTVVQALIDIENRQVGTDDRIVRLEKSLAEILVKIHERLSAIENSIGVR